MAFSCKIDVVYNHIGRLSEEARRLAEAAVLKAAVDVKAYAKRVVPVDIGNLENSIQSKREDPLLWTVGPRGPDYAIYVEYGTYRMRAQPYMRPAADAVKPSFIEAMKKIVKV